MPEQGAGQDGTGRQRRRLRRGVHGGITYLRHLTEYRNIARMASTMVPDAADRPDVLPSERLLANGMAIPELRADLRRIDNLRNAISVAAVWFWVALIIGGAVWIDQWWSYLIAFVLMGPMYARFAILMHEAAHKLLFTNKRWNDWIGKWVVAYPVFTPVQLYRRVHFAHHKDEFGPDEPDIAFYAPYPCTRRALRRRLFRDAVGISGWKNFVPLVKNTLHKPFRPIGLSIFGVQARAVGGHVGRHRPLVDLPAPVVAALDDRVARHQPPALHRRARRHGAQPGPPGHDAQRAPVARWPASGSCPYNTGWHLAHHVDMGVPWRNLPAYHAELERAGYVTDAITYKSYWALWKALSSADEATEVERPSRPEPRLFRSVGSAPCR